MSMYNEDMIFLAKKKTTKYRRRHGKSSLTIGALSLIISLLFSISVSADEPKTDEELKAEAEARKELTVETNEVPNWPSGPAIGAEAAILMDADTGQILYAKNVDEKLMPASTTKIMTCLTAMKRGVDMSDIIHVNQSAIDANDPEGSNMGLYANEELTAEEIITGILVTSANEGCNALAEHIAGSMDGYVDMMNEEAMNMGLSNTHFVTTNGLPDPDHYTTARDLATIAREFFSYDILCRLSSTPYVEIEETSSHRAHSLYSKNKLYKNRDYEYPYLIGSKTGYTDVARQTLVSAAEKDGVRLVCVILMEEAPYQFEDTVNLFDYGFNNFSYSKVSDFENTYASDSDYYQDAHNASLITLNTDVKILLPNNTDYSYITSDITYRDSADPYFADVNYYFNGYYIGSTGLSFTPGTTSIDAIKLANTNGKDIEVTVINVKIVAIWMVIILAGILLLIRLFIFLKKMYYKHKERVKRSQKYEGSHKLNRNADRQRRLGAIREKKRKKKKQRNLEAERKKKLNEARQHSKRNKNRYRD